MFYLAWAFAKLHFIILHQCCNVAQRAILTSDSVFNMACMCNKFKFFLVLMNHRKYTELRNRGLSLKLHQPIHIWIEIRLELNRSLKLKPIHNRNKAGIKPFFEASVHPEKSLTHCWLLTSSLAMSSTCNISHSGWIKR